MGLKRKGSVLLSLLIMTPTFSYATTMDCPTSLNQDATLIDVVVPLSIPIDVDASGNVTTANNFDIDNNSFGPIEIVDISVTPKNSWTLEDFEKDYTDSKVGLKEFGFNIDGKNVPKNGVLPIGIGEYFIPANYSKNLSYDANIAPQKDVITDTTICDIVMVIDWYMNDFTNISYVKVTESDFDYVIATDEELIDEGITEHFVYRGTEEFIEIPSVIAGKEVTNMDGMFLNNTTVKAIKLPNTDIESMNFTFKGCSSLEYVSELPQSLKTLDRAFSDCTSLKIAPALPLNLDSRFGLVSTFRNCSSLLVAPEIPSNISYLTATFKGCTSLLKIPELNDNIISLFYAFSDCENIETIPELPKKLEVLDGTFRDCIKIAEFPNIPNSVYTMVDTFRGDTNIKGTLTIPKSVKTLDNILRGTIKDIVLQYEEGHIEAEAVSVPNNVTKVVINKK